MLDSFLKTSLPYGIEKSGDLWSAFNREYCPLFVPVSYGRISEQKLLSLAWDPESGIEFNKKGEIIKVWLYNDDCVPDRSNENWTKYTEKLRILSTFKCSLYQNNSDKTRCLAEKHKKIYELNGLRQMLEEDSEESLYIRSGINLFNES